MESRNPKGNEPLIDLLWLVAGVRDARAIALCGCVLLVWELLLTFDQELEFFWCPPFAWSKALFFSNRYGSLIFVSLQIMALFSPAPSARFCSYVYGTALYGTFVTLTFAQVVLAVRVLALYQRYRVIRFMLYVLFLGTWGCSLGLSISVQRAMFPITNPFLSQLTVGCLFDGVDLRTVYRLYIPFMVFQTILFVMTTYKGIRSFRAEQTSGIIKLLVRDATIYYFVIIVATGFTVAGTLLRDTVIPATWSNIILPAISLPTTRLMLNLRSSQKVTSSAPAVIQRPLHRINSPTHNRRAGHALGMSSVYEIRGGVRVKEEGRTTFVEVEMDITQPEDAQQMQAGATLWSTTGKWEDAACSGPAFASQARPGLEETHWRDMESAPSLQTSGCLPISRSARPYDAEINEQRTTTPTTGTGIMPYPRRSPNGVIHVVSRTVSEVTDTSGASTVVGSGGGSPDPGHAGDIPTREGARTINWSLPTYNGRNWPAHLM